MLSNHLETRFNIFSVNINPRARGIVGQGPEATRLLQLDPVGHPTAYFFRMALGDEGHIGHWQMGFHGRIQYVFFGILSSSSSSSSSLLLFRHILSIATTRSGREGSGFRSGNWFSSGTWLLLQASGSAFTVFVVGSLSDLGLASLSSAICILLNRPLLQLPPLGAQLTDPFGSVWSMNTQFSHV